jgi:hypothetical protein
MRLKLISNSKWYKTEQFIYSQFLTSKIFISGGFSSVLILAYNHTQFEDQENMRENIKSRVYHSSIV